MNKQGLFLFVGSLLFSPFLFAYNNIPNIWQNNQAVGLQALDKRTEAFDEFSKLLAEEPFNPLFNYNLGTGFLSVEEVEKAKKIFASIAEKEKGNPYLVFASNFNLGAIHGAMGEIDDALKYYQAALEFMPTSKEVKTNIELLIQSSKGKGKNKNKNDKKGKGQQDQQDQQQNQDEKDDEQQQQPQKFENSPQNQSKKNMSPQDVKKILEELKKQEQRIRAKHDRKGAKEKDRDKNW